MSKNYVILFVVMIGTSQTLTAQWSTTQLPDPRVEPSGIYAAGKVFFAGGFTQYTPSYITSKEVSIYDVTTQTWSSDTLSEARWEVATAVVGDKVIFAGGTLTTVFSNKVDIYNTTSDTWIRTEMPIHRGAMQSAVIGNTVYFVGGFSNNFDSIGYIMTYQADTGIWGFISTPTIKYSPGVVAFGNKLVIAGGYNSDNLQLFKSVDIYDTPSGTWTTIQMPATREAQSVFSVGNKLYFVGGYDSNGDPATTIYIYDYNTSSWTTKSFLQKRIGAGIALLGNRIYLAGGALFSTKFKSVEVFNTTTASFEPQMQLSQARYSISAVPASDRIFFAGGIYNVTFIAEGNSDVVDIFAPASSTNDLPRTGHLEVQPTLANEQILLTVEEDKAIASLRNLTISDLAGRIYSSKYQIKSDKQIQVNIADLPSGYYAIRLTTKNGIWAGRFIKQ